MKALIFPAVTMLCFFIGACSKKEEGSSSSNTVEVSPGEAIVKKNCKVCHAQGINGAPIIGNSKMWVPRLEKSIDELAGNAANGFGLMPAKGGNTELSDDEIRLAVEFMVSKVK